MITLTRYATAEERLEIIHRLERVSSVIESENILLLIGRRFEVHITPREARVYEQGKRILRVERENIHGLFHILPEKRVRVSRILRTRFQHERLSILLDVDHDSEQTRIILTHPVEKGDDPAVIREYVERFATLLPGREKGEWQGEHIPLHVQGKANPRILRMLPKA